MPMELTVSKLRVQCFGVSLDGFGAGPGQNLEHPLGVHGPELMEWFFATNLWKQMHDLGEGEKGIDNRMAEQGFENVGAWILGRNMFGPIRGEWPDDDWKGWWGDEPPYRVPVFVLTHHARAPLAMKGGTTFHFVTDGIESALSQAQAAAGEKDVMVAGGASAVRQYLRAGLLDELYLHVAPVVLGAGERLLDGVGDPHLEPVEVIASPAVTHIRYRIARS